ncbi:tripartite tricarboxylate transporter TctB family protein [Propylenella binzhouense]|uniref:tripartite tricarboxylate transporter TctB family protein n=1 Tax=Propylenella binzhouense TaxID=2555902 RepID=UPI001369D5DF
MDVKIRSIKNLASGIIFLAIAAVFWTGSFAMPIGTAARMGPGYFPQVLSVLLALLGAGIVASSLYVEDSMPAAFHWRGLAFIIGAAVLFGVLLKPLGIVPALGATILITTMASPNFRPATALVLAVGLVGFVWIVFVEALHLPWVAFGPWLGGY